MVKIEYQDGREDQKMESQAAAEAALMARGFHAGAQYDVDEATMIEYWPTAEQAAMEQAVPAPASIVVTK